MQSNIDSNPMLNRMLSTTTKSLREHNRYIRDNDHKFSNLMLALLEKYRNFINKFVFNCNCAANINDHELYNELEKEYKLIFANRLTNDELSKEIILHKDLNNKIHNVHLSNLQNETIINGSNGVQAIDFIKVIGPGGQSSNINNNLINLNANGSLINVKLLPNAFTSTSVQSKTTPKILNRRTSSSKQIVIPTITLEDDDECSSSQNRLSHSQLTQHHGGNFNDSNSRNSSLVSLDKLNSLSMTPGNNNLCDNLLNPSQLISSDVSNSFCQLIDPLDFINTPSSSNLITLKSPPSNVSAQTRHSNFINNSNTIPNVQQSESSDTSSFIQSFPSAIPTNNTTNSRNIAPLGKRKIKIHYITTANDNQNNNKSLRTTIVAANAKDSIGNFCMNKISNYDADMTTCANDQTSNGNVSLLGFVSNQVPNDNLNNNNRKANNENVNQNNNNNLHPLVDHNKVIETLVDGFGDFRCHMQDCLYSTSIKANLFDHLRKFHQLSRPFKCTYPGCDAMFKEKYKLKVHSVVHTGEKPFLCTWPNCKARFSQSGHLSRHRKTHLSTEKLVCTWSNCTRTFRQKHSLKYHLMIHKGEKPWRCEMANCGKSFIEKWKFAKHQKTHHKQ